MAQGAGQNAGNAAFKVRRSGRIDLTKTNSMNPGQGEAAGGARGQYSGSKSSGGRSENELGSQRHGVYEIHGRSKRYQLRYGRTK